ncbi:MAG: FG-GAP repeat protein [Deltaproteobacteria bacterium]|nr:FG-GAP repeat protein [Deltaproteobacteria bacterium]
MWLFLLACFVTDKEVRQAFDPDGDGYGAPEDCAPDDPTNYPGSELCGDGMVTECGLTVEDARARCRLQGELSLAEADLKIVGENPGDNVAESVAGGGDVDGDGRSDLLVDAFGNDAGGSLAGAVYLLLSSGCCRGMGQP